MSRLPPESELSPRARGIALACVLMGTALLRTRLLAIPLERDEGEFAIGGQLLLQGTLPFEAVYSMKMPGIYAAYAAVMALFGETIVGIHLGLLAVNLASITLLYVLVRRTIGSLEALAAAALFALLSVQPAVLGVFAHATHFVVLLALAGLVLLVRPRGESTGSEAWRALGAGVLLGTAFTMKQHGAAFVALGGIWILFDPSASVARPETRTRALGLAALYAVGVLAPIALWVALIASVGAFETLRFWTIDYAFAYTNIRGLDVAIDALREALPKQLATLELLWLLALGGLGVSCLGPMEPRARAWVLLFTGFSALATLPGFYFRQHYFVLAQPAIALLAALATSRLIGRLSPATPPGGRAAVVLGVVAILIAVNLTLQRDYFFRLPVETLSHRLYRPHFFPESVRIAEYVADLSEPDDLVAVIGSEPQIYFYARRRPATGFMYMYPLMEAQPFARSMQEELANEIQEARPKVIVYYNGPGGWAASRDSDLTIRRFARYFARRYELAGIADLSVSEGSQYVFGAKASEHRPRSADWVGIYVRPGD